MPKNELKMESESAISIDDLKSFEKSIIKEISTRINNELTESIDEQLKTMAKTFGEKIESSVELLKNEIRNLGHQSLKEPRPAKIAAKEKLKRQSSTELKSEQSSKKPKTKTETSIQKLKRIVDSFDETTSDILLFKNLNLFYENEKNGNNDNDIDNLKNDHFAWWERYRKSMVQFFFGGKEHHPNSNDSANLQNIQRNLITRLFCIIGVAKCAKLFENEKNKDCFFFYRDAINFKNCDEQTLKNLLVHKKKPYNADCFRETKLSVWDILVKPKAAKGKTKDIQMNYCCGFIEKLAAANASGQLQNDANWKRSRCNNFWDRLLSTYKVKKEDDAKQNKQDDQDKQDDEGNQDDEDDEGNEDDEGEEEEN